MPEKQWRLVRARDLEGLSPGAAHCAAGKIVNYYQCFSVQSVTFGTCQKHSFPRDSGLLDLKWRPGNMHVKKKNASGECDTKILRKHSCPANVLTSVTSFILTLGWNWQLRLPHASWLRARFYHECFNEELSRLEFSLADIYVYVIIWFTLFYRNGYPCPQTLSQDLQVEPAGKMCEPLSSLHRLPRSSGVLQAERRAEGGTARSSEGFLSNIPWDQKALGKQKQILAEIPEPRGEPVCHSMLQTSKSRIGVLGKMRGH